MRVRHTVAAGLAGILLIQSAALAQTLAQSLSEPAVADDGIVKVPQREALYRLFEAMVRVDPEQRVRFEILGGEILEGSIVELSPDRITIGGGRRSVVPLANIVGLRPRKTKPGMSNSSAFGIGAAVGGGIAVSIALAAVVAAMR